VEIQGTKSLGAQIFLETKQQKQQTLMTGNEHSHLIAVSPFPLHDNGVLLDCWALYHYGEFFRSPHGFAKIRLG